jgi:putative nucleotidyltransferase with HDIG domain
LTRQHVLRFYVALIAALTLGVLGVGAVGVTRLSSQTLIQNLFPAALLIAVSWYGSQRRVLVSESDIWLMGTVGYIATLVLLPFPLAILSVAASKGLAEGTLLAKKQRHSWKGVTVNAGGTILGVAVGGGVFSSLHGVTYLWSHQLDSVFALPVLLVMILLYNVTNELVVVGAITLTSQENPWSVFWRLSRAALIPEISLALVGIVFAVLYHSSPIMAAFIVVPVMFSLRAFESVATLRRETVEAVLRMAEHLDFRDTSTYEHSQRLADLTRRLAAELELTPEHVEEIVLASRVHDLGKIGISNEILLKQGPLTEDEGDIMRKHPVIGAEILDSYSMFKSSVKIVRHHHERWDGKGYPDGISGEHIPLGARVIAVADSFDAMTADRPYRKGLTADEAVERLKAGMGTQYDPKLCAIFIQILMEEGIYTPSEPVPGELHLIAGGRASGGRAS